MIFFTQLDALVGLQIAQIGLIGVLLYISRNKAESVASIAPIVSSPTTVPSYAECVRCHAVVARYTSTTEGNICANCAA